MTWQPKLTPTDLGRFLEEHFPQALEFPVAITHLEEGALDLRLTVDAKNLRPGGTVSGPTLMTLADTAMYFLLLTHLGPLALAVTTSLHIDFLRRPEPRDVIARAELLKLGRSLAVGRVTVRSEGDARPVAHASITYSLPPR
ncbi:MAG: PaaI family thioesterase [Deltaproteobacteria bacterium]|nr:PaaI family thioesterase [Deltaproteobacteria bacterium]